MHKLEPLKIGKHSKYGQIERAESGAKRQEKSPGQINEMSVSLNSKCH